MYFIVVRSVESENPQLRRENMPWEIEIIFYDGAILINNADFR